MLKRKNRNSQLLGLLLGCTLLTSTAWAGGKLLGTSGVGSVEGSGGGGLIPWATLAAYSSRDDRGVALTFSRAESSDVAMNVSGIAASFYDRLELSLARQEFEVKASGDKTRQNIAGVKLRLLGDLIYGQQPLLSLGLQYKSLLDSAGARAVGAEGSHGTDVYLSVARAWLDGPFNRTAFVNFNLRNSEANQLGLMGFGGDEGDRQWLLEGAAGFYFNRYWATGIEYRQKPDNLSALEEDDWASVFVSHFPSKAISITAAYVHMGDVVGLGRQAGWYLSLQGTF